MSSEITQELPCLGQCSHWISYSFAVVILGEKFSRVLPHEKFSSFMKLSRVTALVLKFGSMLWQLDVDSKRQAAIFLMKTMQQQAYPEELEFLLDHSDRTVP